MAPGNSTISIVLPDLRPGGAERMHVELARFWAQQGLEVSFVVREKKGALVAALPASTSVHELHAPRARSALKPLVRYLREKNPDAVLAPMWPLTVIVPLAAQIARYKGRIVISEHAPQSLSYASRGRLHNTLMAASMRLMYPTAHARVAVSDGVACDMARLSALSRNRFAVIHNPAALGRVLPRKERPLSVSAHAGPFIISVGTLKPVKRHDLLIRAFARIANEARLCILGEGSERARLEALISELGLDDRVLLPGYQADPAPWYAYADLFVLSSDHEGFGNVIVEALEQGTPVVSTDCPYGPREILAHGKFGVLVPTGNVGELADAMQASLTSWHDRSALRRRAHDFSVDKAADAYLKLLLAPPGV